MARRIIVNADDFGLSEGVNQGVLKACAVGVARSASLMVNMPAAAHALQLAKMLPGLSISQHTNFVLGRPCADPDKIPSMLDENGNFHRSGKYRSGERSFVYDEVKEEITAQIHRFRELTGKYPEHIEGHAVGGETVDAAFYDVARRFGIHASLFDPSSKTKYRFEGYRELVAPQGLGEVLSRGVSVDDFLTDAFGIMKMDVN